MSQRISGYARQPDDEYETPAWCTQVVAPYLAKLCLRPWDPANGPQSAIAEELRACGFEAWATNDNFLARTSPPYSCIDGVCTNPPYGSQGKLACQFISHALNLVPVVVMLLRVDFDSGNTRTHLFDRIIWFERHGANGPSDNHAWFLWNKRHRGEPTISYERRPQ